MEERDRTREIENENGTGNIGKRECHTNFLKGQVLACHLRIQFKTLK